MDESGLTKKDLKPVVIRVLALNNAKLDENLGALISMMPDFVIDEINKQRNQEGAILGLNTLYAKVNGSYNPSLKEIQKAIVIGSGGSMQDVADYAKSLRKKPKYF